MHHILWIFLTVWIAMSAFSFSEAYVEGRNAGDKGKLGWRLRIAGRDFAAYHFFLFQVMFPLFILVLPFVATDSWDPRTFGILLSAYASGVILEDFIWYMVNPVVRLLEFWTPFSDYFPWVRISGRKILPVHYFLYGALAIASWYFLWR